MMPKFNKTVNIDEDLTSFAPRGESTRRVNFPIPPPRALSPMEPVERNSQVVNFNDSDVTTFAPRGESTRMIKFPIPPPKAVSPIQSLERSPKMMDGGDVSTFAHRGESNRKINFQVPPPSVSPIQSLGRSPKMDGVDFNSGDVTTFAPRGESTRKINFPIPPPKAVSPLERSPKRFNLNSANVSIHAPRGESTRKIDLQIPHPEPQLTPVSRPDDVQNNMDVTSFMPGSESTRKINFNAAPLSDHLPSICISEVQPDLCSSAEEKLTSPKNNFSDLEPNLQRDMSYGPGREKGSQEVGIPHAVPSAGLVIHQEESKVTQKNQRLHEYPIDKESISSSVKSKDGDKEDKTMANHSLTNKADNRYEIIEA